METDDDLLQIFQELGELVKLDGREIWVTWDQSRIDGPISQYERVIQARTSDLEGLTEASVLERLSVEYAPILGSLDDDGQGVTEFRVKQR